MNGFVDCAKRLGRVLAGRVDPSVEAVRRAAAEVREAVAMVSVRAFYNGTVREPVPKELIDLVNALPSTGPQHFQPRRQKANGRGPR
jgi:hypothetical protein